MYSKTLCVRVCSALLHKAQNRLIIISSQWTDFTRRVTYTDFEIN